MLRRSPLMTDRIRSRIVMLFHTVGGIIALHALIAGFLSSGLARIAMFALADLTAGWLLGFTLWLLLPYYPTRRAVRLALGWMILMPLLALSTLSVYVAGTVFVILWILVAGSQPQPLLRFLATVTLFAFACFLLALLLGSLMDNTSNIYENWFYILIGDLRPHATRLTVLFGALGGLLEAGALTATLTSPPSGGRKIRGEGFLTDWLSIAPPDPLSPGLYTLGDDGELVSLSDEPPPPEQPDLSNRA